MAYVNVPNDLSRIKTKLAFNLTKRQLVCFGTAAVIGIPAYLLARSSIGGTGAMLLMIALMLPFFFLAMYERDGLPAEKPDRPVPEGAKISVRGLGKIRLTQVGGKTKKDRISVVIHRYV